MQIATPEILFEDNHLLVLNKPSGWVTQGAADNAPSALDWAREDIKRRFNKPGNVYLGVVSRLDTFVSGVWVVAKTSKAAARLTEQFAKRSTQKIYWAVVTGKVEPATGTWRDHLAKNERLHRVEVVPHGHRDAQIAELNYKRLATNEKTSWLEVELVTGRKHQIRVQCTSHGHAIVGDQKYESDERFVTGAISLHSRKLVLEHPTKRELLEFVAPLPASWQKFEFEFPKH